MSATTIEDSREARSRIPVLESNLWDEIWRPNHSFLASVNERLEAQVKEFEPEIAEYARYALANQGKQLRSILVSAAARAVGEVSDAHITVAVIIEMIHLATLVHDDIIDVAALRRGRPTLAARWGNEVSVLLGDCLFAQALRLAASFPTPDVCRAVATSTQTVCAGEILQTHCRRRWDVDRSYYFKVVGMKTGELFALACNLGASLANATQTQISALQRYGMNLGTAYQIYDDCLDLFGNEAEAGKSLGTDLASGKATLPLILFFEKAVLAEKNQLLDWLVDWRPEQASMARKLLNDQKCLEGSMDVLSGFLNQASQALLEIPAGAGHDTLQHFLRFLSQRSKALAV